MQYFVILLFLFLAACGGGNSSSENSAANSEGSSTSMETPNGTLSVNFSRSSASVGESVSVVYQLDDGRSKDANVRQRPVAGTIHWDDGTDDRLSPQGGTITHVYSQPGTYRVHIQADGGQRQQVGVITVAGGSAGNDAAAPVQGVLNIPALSITEGTTTNTQIAYKFKAAAGTNNVFVLEETVVLGSDIVNSVEFVMASGALNNGVSGGISYPNLAFGLIARFDIVTDMCVINGSLVPINQLIMAPDGSMFRVEGNITCDVPSKTVTSGPYTLTRQ